MSEEDRTDPFAKIQRRLNQKLSDATRKERGSRARDPAGRRNPNRQNDGENDTREQRNQAQSSTRSRRSTRRQESAPRRVQIEDEDDEYEELEDDQDEERRPTSGRSRNQSIPEPLPLEDREFEEEFGQELLQKAFRDADRGSQHDNPTRRSMSRPRDVQIKFVNNRSGAYFPGLNDEVQEEDRKSRSSSRSQSQPLPGILRSRGFAVGEGGEDEEDPRERGRTKSYGYPTAAAAREDEEEWEDEAASPPPIIIPPTKSTRRSTSSRSSRRKEPQPERKESRDVLRTRSSNSVVFDPKTVINRPSERNRGSRSNVRSASRSSLDRRGSSSQRKASEEILGADSGTNDIDVGYSRSNPKLNASSRGSFSGRNSSREVTALPIEIPDGVTDEAAFRRYLSRNSYESVGGGGGRLPAAMAMKNFESNRKAVCLCFAIVSIALLSASTCQLRYVVAYSSAHKYPVLNYFLICISIIIEITTGIGYVVLARFPIPEARVDFVNGLFVAGLFVVAINNVVIAAFAFDDHICEQYFIAKVKEIGTAGSSVDVIDQNPNL